MTLPRPVIPNTTQMITRRCLHRQLLLNPSKEVNQAYLYLLAVAAERYEMQVHAFIANSNHYHNEVTDTKGNRPEFCRWFNQFLAKYLNYIYGRFETFWSPGSYSAVDLVDEPSVLDKIVYIETNPVKDGLVRNPQEWPGVSSFGIPFGETIDVHKPKEFFRDKGLPKVARLKLVKPLAFAELSDEEATKMVRKTVAAKVKEIQEEFDKADRDFMGREAVLAQSHFDFPAGYDERRKLNPKVATHNKRRRIKALSQHKAFQQAYREAWERYKAGDHDVEFPYGTYWMRVHAGVKCVAPD